MYCKNTIDSQGGGGALLYPSPPSLNPAFTCEITIQNLQIMQHMAESLCRFATLVAEGALRPIEITTVQEFLSKMNKISSSSPDYTSFSPHSTSTSQDFITKCPPEILEHILQFLPPKDLKSAVCVSKNFAKVGGKPKLWSWAKLSLHPDSPGSAFEFVNNTRGIASLEATSLSAEETSNLMCRLAELTYLKKLHLEGCAMVQVRPSVLSNAVSNLEVLCVDNLIMTDEQSAALFSSLSKLFSLTVQETDLSRLASGIITPAAKLRHLKLNNTLLTTEQTNQLWNAIEKEECNFSSLQLAGVNLASVNPEAMAETARTALKIGFCDAGLTGEQANAVASALAENSRIEEIDLSDNSLSNIDPELLARAVARTKNLNLANAALSSDQMKEILEAVLSDECGMKIVDLSGNEMSLIDPDLMAQSLIKITSVTLFDSNVSVNQVWQSL